jgi:hypothetical protein
MEVNSMTLLHKEIEKWAASNLGVALDWEEFQAAKIELTHLIEAYTEDRVLEAKAKLAKSILVFGGDLPPHTKEYLQSLEQLKSKKDKV